MRGDPPALEMGDIAASGLPLLERAQGMLEALERWLPVEATWLALSDPLSHVYATAGSTRLERSVLDYLDRPSVSREIRLAGLDQSHTPVSLAELPIAADDLPTWAECLIPAGFRNGLGLPLVEPDGRYVGMLTLLFTSVEEPSAELRDELGRLAPVIARGVSPMHSLVATARLAHGATYGAVLLADGGIQPLPGLWDHPLLEAGSAVVQLARQALGTGQVYRSFLWPLEDRCGSPGYGRITILGSAEVPALVSGTLLITPEADCRSLTPRELEVLGHLVQGCSNQQIARRLGVTPRTVAAHMEHLLQKLDVPTRTLAAVQAEREGCYVPPMPAAGVRR